jgi:hypothetical protein
VQVASLDCLRCSLSRDTSVLLALEARLALVQSHPSDLQQLGRRRSLAACGSEDLACGSEGPACGSEGPACGSEGLGNLCPRGSLGCSWRFERVEENGVVGIDSSHLVAVDNSHLVAVSTPLEAVGSSHRVAVAVESHHLVAVDSHHLVAVSTPLEAEQTLGKLVHLLPPHTVHQQAEKIAGTIQTSIPRGRGPSRRIPRRTGAVGTCWRQARRWQRGH